MFMFMCVCSSFHLYFFIGGGAALPSARLGDLLYAAAGWSRRPSGCQLGVLRGVAPTKTAEQRSSAALAPANGGVGNAADARDGRAGLPCHRQALGRGPRRPVARLALLLMPLFSASATKNGRGWRGRGPARTRWDWRRLPGRRLSDTPPATPTACLLLLHGEKKKKQASALVLPPSLGPQCNLYRALPTGVKVDVVVV